MCPPGPQATPLWGRDRTGISVVTHILLPSGPVSPSGQITKGTDINSMTPASVSNLETSLSDRLDQVSSSVQSLDPWDLVERLYPEPTEAPGEMQVLPTEDM